MRLLCTTKPNMYDDETSCINQNFFLLFFFNVSCACPACASTDWQTNWNMTSLYVCVASIRIATIVYVNCGRASFYYNNIQCLGQIGCKKNVQMGENTMLYGMQHNHFHIDFFLLLYYAAGRLTTSCVCAIFIVFNLMNTIS